MHDGRQRVVVLHGPPGSGRSRALRELTRESDARVVLVRAAAGYDVPGWAAAELVLRTAAVLGIRRPRRVPPQPERAVALAESWWREQDGPVLVAVDDADRADPPSRAAFAALVERLLTPGADPGVRLALTLTAGGPDGPLVRRVAVPPLDVAGTAALAADRLGAPLDDASVAALHAATGGLPGAVTGVLDDARDRGALRGAGPWLTLDAAHRLALPAAHPLVWRSGPGAPVARETRRRSVPPWRRPPPDTTGLPDATAAAVVRAHELGRPVDGTGADEIAAELLDLATDPAPAAAAHLARTGQWERLARMPRRLVGADASLLAERTRAVLLTDGLAAALGDLARWTGDPELDEPARHLQEELLEYAGRRPDRPGGAGALLRTEDAALADHDAGRWDSVVAAAVADRATGRGAHGLATAGEVTALAALVHLDRGEPVAAQQWLDSCPVAAPEDVPPVLLECARAAMDLLRDRAGDAITRLERCASWLRDAGVERHGDLVTDLLVDAQLRAGHLDEAARLLDATEPVPGPGRVTARLRVLRGRLELGAARGDDVDERLVASCRSAARTLERARRSRFGAARARLVLAHVTGDAEHHDAAAAAFTDLGAALWLLRLPGATAGPVLDRVTTGLVTCGLSNAAIGTALGRTEKYVKRTVSRLLAAAGVSSRTELAARGVRPAVDGPAQVRVLVGRTGSGRSTALAEQAGPERQAVLVHGRDPTPFALATAIAGRLGTATSPLLRAAVRRPDAALRMPVALELLARLRASPQEVLLLVDDADALDAHSAALLPVLALELPTVLTARPGRAGAAVAARTGARTQLLPGPGVGPPDPVLDLVAGMAGLRIGDADLLAPRHGIDGVRARVEELLDAGELVLDTDGGLRTAADRPAAVPASAADHRLVAEHLLAGGRPVEAERLAAHIVGAELRVGRAELAAIAAATVEDDPERAGRWAALLLAAEPTDHDLLTSAATTAALAGHATSRFWETAELAGEALARMPEGGPVTPHDDGRLAMRSVLASSLVRLPAPVGPDAEPPSREVTATLHEARRMIMSEEFDRALRALAGINPAHPGQRAAQLAGVRLLAALSAEGAADGPDPLSRADLALARTTLRFGDLYSAESVLMAGGHPGPTATRPAPPDYARLAAAVDGLRHSDWGAVLAVADGLPAADRPPFTDVLVSALAGEALTRQGRLAEAADRLAPLPHDLLFGHVVRWAQAGLAITRGDQATALEVLTAAERRCVDKGYLPGRELLLSRRVEAELAAGDRPAARVSLRRLAEVCVRIGSPEARLTWQLQHAAVTGDTGAAHRSEVLAGRLGNRFALARARQLRAALARLGPEGSAGRAEFERLAADPWYRSVGVADEPEPFVPGGRDRELLDLLAGGATNAAAAAAMHVSEKAVEARLHKLYRRTGLRSRVDLVRTHGQPAASNPTAGSAGAGAVSDRA